MANDITKNPIYITDTGVITTTPLWIKKILLVPGTAADTATLKYWIEYPGKERVHKQNITTDADTTDYLGATGEFAVTTMAVVTDAIHIYKSSTALNLGTWEIGTRSDDNHIHVLPATIVNDATGVYSWKVYASYPLAEMKSQATNLLNYELDFGPRGLYVPNLMVTALVSGGQTAAQLYIYL